MAKLKKVARSFADRLRESPYGGYDPKKDPYVKRHPVRQPVTYNPDKNITQDILRNVGTTGRNLAALTLGLPGDIQDISALKDAPRQLPNSEQLAKTFGGDPNHPSWLPASLIAPGPGEAKAGMNLLAKIGGNIDPTWAMTLFHGTPHKFDKFALDKIGTGEGAQAFGHGLYFAENPGVARSYQLSTTGTTPKIQEISQKLDRVNHKAHAHRAGIEHASSPEQKARFQDRLSNTEREQKLLRDEMSAEMAKTGHLYEIELPDEITERMLDWDAPLSELPDEARPILGNRLEFIGPSERTAMAEELDLIANNDQAIYNVWTGGDGELTSHANGILKRISDGAETAADKREVNRLFSEYGKSYAEDYGGNNFIEALRFRYGRTIGDAIEAEGKSPELTRQLRDAGIPGIRFLDGGSRQAGDGTRNIVVFDPEDITQVKRDGQEVFKK